MLRQVGARAFDELSGGGGGDRRHLLAVLAAGSVPLVVLGILLSAPHLDGHWENNSAHFWIVLIAGLVSTSLGYAVREAALRRHDARLFLVSLGFIASAGFLALHALATPGVVVGGKNAGFVIAPPVGLLIAGVFVAASALDLSPAAGAAVMRRSRLLTGAVLALIAAWGVVSVAELPPLSHSLERRRCARPAGDRRRARRALLRSAPPPATTGCTGSGTPGSSSRSALPSPSWPKPRS